MPGWGRWDYWARSSRWGGGVGGLEWLLYDTFTTDDAAPITSPRTCEPGPGTLTIVDTGNNADLVGGVSQWTGISGAGDPRYYSDLGQASRLVGLASFAKCSIDASAGNRLYVGLHAADVATPQLSSNYLQGTTLRAYNNSVPASVGTVADETLESYLTVLRSYGSFSIQNGKLMWASNEYAGNADWLEFSSSVGASKTNATNLGALSLPANGYTAWDTDFSTVTDSETNPATSTTYDCDADCHIRTTFTYETGKYVNVRARRTGTTYYTDAVYARTDGRLDIRDVDASGTDTLAAVAGTFSDGVAYQIDSVFSGSSIKVYVNNVLKADVTSAKTANHSVASGLLYHTLATNDIVLTTHPYPALGIATSRAIAPQETDTATHTADCLAYMRGVTLPSAGSLEYTLRETA